MLDEHGPNEHASSRIESEPSSTRNEFEQITYAPSKGYFGLDIQKVILVWMSLLFVPVILFGFSGLLFVRSGLGMPGFELYLICIYLGIPFFVFSFYVLSVIRKLRRHRLSSRWPLLCLLLDWLVFGGCYLAVQLKYFW